MSSRHCPQSGGWYEILNSAGGFLGECTQKRGCPECGTPLTLDVDAASWVKLPDHDYPAWYKVNGKAAWEV